MAGGAICPGRAAGSPAIRRGAGRRGDLYQMCGGDPLNRRDTSGMDWEFTWDPREWEPLAFASEEVAPQGVRRTQGGWGGPSPSPGALHSVRREWAASSGHR